MPNAPPPPHEFKATAVLPYVKSLSEQLRRCLQQQDVRAVFKSETTLRSQLVRPKDAIDLAKQDGVVFRIPCECGITLTSEEDNRLSRLANGDLDDEDVGDDEDQTPEDERVAGESRFQD